MAQAVEVQSSTEIEQPRHPRSIGAVPIVGLLLCVAAIAASDLVNGYRSVFGPTRWILTATALLAAMTYSFLSRTSSASRFRSFASGYVLSALLQLAATGAIATRHWVPFMGAHGGTYERLGTLRLLALSLALVAATSAVIAFRQQRSELTRHTRLSVRTLLVAVAVTAVLSSIPASIYYATWTRGVIGGALLVAPPMAVALYLKASDSKAATYGALAALALAVVSMGEATPFW